MLVSIEIELIQRQLNHVLAGFGKGRAQLDVRPIPQGITLKPRRYAGFFMGAI